MSGRKEQRYNDRDHQVNVPQKIAPGNLTYGKKYGKKAIVIGDSHLQRINRKLFNESLPTVGGVLNILVVLRLWI